MSKSETFEITDNISSIDEGVSFLNEDIDKSIVLYYTLIDQYLKQKQKYKISRKTICKQTGLSYEGVFKIDTFKSIPRIDTMFKLLDAVGCSIELNLIDNHANSTD